MASELNHLSLLNDQNVCELGMHVQLSPHNEEAAIGAALCAAVADGSFNSMNEASASFLNFIPPSASDEA